MMASEGTKCVKSEHVDESEARLLLAEKESLKSNRMLPVIKEELRLRIMSKRHDQGKDEIVVDFNNNNTTYELTDAEREKKKRRREQNRRAAQRCRLKKKRMQKGTVENYEMIVEKHYELKDEVKHLATEVQQLQAILDNHMNSGSCLHEKREQRDNASPCSHSFIEDRDLLTDYNAQCVTASQDPVTNSWIVSNDIHQQSCLPCGLVQDFNDNDGQDFWSTQRFQKQVVSTSRKWSDDVDISDIVGQFVDFEESAGVLADDPFEGNNQSFYDSSRPTQCHQHQCEKQQCDQVLYNQVDGTQSPSNESLCIRHQDTQSPCGESCDQSVLYLENMDGLDHLDNTSGCDKNYLDLSIMEP